MFTLTIQDEEIYKRLMERVEQRGESLDEVLRELLNQEEESPALKLLRLIDTAELVFHDPFDGRDAEDILSREAGDINWRATKDDDGSA